MRRMKRKTRRSSRERMKFIVTQSFKVERNDGVINNFGASKVRMQGLNGQPDSVEYQVETPEFTIKPEFAPNPPQTEPTPQPAPQTTTEPEKKGKGWKFWLGIALAGVAAAGVGTYMFNNKK